MTFDVRHAEKSRLAETNFNELPFGRIFSDHMFRADYNGKDWTNAAITPYAALSIDPSAAVIHYGQSIFEGMKAYRSANN